MSGLDEAAGELEIKEAPGSATVPLRRNAGFRMLWIGQVLSDTGTEVALIAYPLLILALTHSPALAGVVATARLAVQLGLGLPGGALSDRLDRRLTMIVCDGTRAGVLALLGVLVLMHLATWPIVLGVAVIDAGANVLFEPSVVAALPTVVDKSQLEQAWAANEAKSYAASLAGPALGGALFGLASAAPFVGDSISYLISAGTVSRIRGRFRAQRSADRESLWRETIAGIHLVRQNALLRAAVVQAPLINFAFTGVIFTITVALRRHGTAPGVIGLVQAGIAVGGLAGALIAPRLQGKLPISRMVIGLTFSATVAFAAAALLLPSTLVALPIAITLLLVPTANAALFGAMLRVAPEDMRGRVTSTVLQSATALAALAPLVSGLLLEHYSGRWAMLAFTAAIGAAAVLSIGLKGLKEADIAAAESG